MHRILLLAFVIVVQLAACHVGCRGCGGPDNGADPAADCGCGCR
jgi:hypothetical protein